MPLSLFFDYVALASAALAAVFAVRAATVHVRDNIDSFMEDIHRQSRWATFAALANAVAVAALVAERFL